MISLLSKTPMDHHARLIQHLIPKLVELGVPSLEKYFDRRIFHPEFCNKITLAKISNAHSGGVMAIPSTMVNDTEEHIRKALNNNSE